MRLRRHGEEHHRSARLVPPVSRTGVRPGAEHPWQRVRVRELDGPEQDHAEAARWCGLAAEQGDAEGQFCLALLYGLGAGVEQDYAKSVDWYRLAARADREVTVVAGREYTSGREIGFHLLVLGTMYREGVALPRNDATAHEWLNIAERWKPDSWWSTETPDGEVRLAEEIRTLADGMTAEQLAKAQLAADAFLETYRDS